jgi:hypothetical protein
MNYIVNYIVNYFENYNKIQDRLFIGNRYTLNDKDFLEKNNISIIINCANKLEFKEELPNIEYIKLNIEDSLKEKDFLLMQSSFRYLLPYLHNEYFVNKKNILIVCNAGRQRSAILIAAFLFDNFEYFFPNETKNKQVVFHYIQNIRPQVFSFGYRINFLQSFNNHFDNKWDFNHNKGLIYFPEI